VVVNDDEQPPPVHFGDHPHGAYWSAERPAEVDADEPVEHSVSGSTIDVMWDYGVRVPLWDAEGLLPENPAWLRDVLGLSEQLIADLGRWGREMTALDATPSRRTPEAFEALNGRGRELARRVQQEIGARYTVTYRRW